MPNGICFKQIALENRALLNAALAREAALREELAALRDSYESMRDRKNSIVDLQKRLNVAEQLLTSIASTIPHIEANNKESAREIVRRINAVLNKSEGGSES